MPKQPNGAPSKKPPAPSVKVPVGPANGYRAVSTFDGCGKEESNKVMTLILRKQRVQDRMEGREPLDWSEDDYAVVDETRIGRIYRHHVPAGWKWVWFLQTVPAPPPNNGVADTLDEAEAALAKRYAEVKKAT